MSLNISVVNYDDIHSIENIKEELRDVNEKIILLEKKLLNANRNLTFVYSSDKVLEQSLQAGDDDERVECERHLLSYGDSLTALEDASRTHDQQVARLGRDLARLRDRHAKERLNLKSILLSLKLSLQPATSSKDKMKIEPVDEELEKQVRRQAGIEREVVRLRTRQLLAGPSVRVSAGPADGVRILELRSQQSSSSHQLEQTRRLLAQQGAERQQVAHVATQAAAKNAMLDGEMQSLHSDLDMANLEYAAVCGDYRRAQEQNRMLRERVQDARTSRLLAGLSQRHDEAIWSVISLDATTKRERQRCAALHALLAGSRLKMTEMEPSEHKF